MQKRDLKKELKLLYRPSSKVVVEVNVPEFNFLMIDGEGDPNTAGEYAHAVEALFSASYAIKFMIKKSALAIDYVVMPLEGLWWADDMSAFASNRRDEWKWTMMIMQPVFVTHDIVDKAIDEITKKKNLPGVIKLRLEALSEGRCAQILHIGPFAEEGPTIERVHQFIDARSERTGRHHEIYLSDIRRADPKKWKTIVRQPMK